MDLLVCIVQTYRRAVKRESCGPARAYVLLFPLPPEAQFRLPHNGGGYMRVPAAQWSGNMTTNQ